MTETEWLARLNPRRIPELYRERMTARRRYLLCCTYALHIPGVLENAFARNFVKTIRDAVLVLPSGRAFQAAASRALAARFPDYFPSGQARWDLHYCSELGSDAHSVSRFLSLVLAGKVWPNDVVSWVLTAIKQRTPAQVRETLVNLAHDHVGRSAGLWGAVRALVRSRAKKTHRDAVLELVPAKNRERMRAVAWNGDVVPATVVQCITASAVQTRVAEASARMSALAQEILGSPFHKPAFDPAWLMCNNGAAQHIAEQIAATGNFADMPILADAIEDAGCRDEELLRHCRQERTHVLGCWALDAVLGRG
jgi:hypothetical protein